MARKTRDLRGGEHPSALAASVMNVHIVLEDKGKISNLRREVPVRLKEKCDHCGAEAIVYKVDFAYEINGKTVYVEAKGIKTPSYKKRERLWRQNPPGRLEVWMGSHKNPRCVEVIE